VRLLGRGASGRAVLLRSKTNAALVVAKEVRLDGMSATSLSDIENEVCILASLHHPNIIAYLGVYRPDEQHLAIVTEFADGGSLSEAIGLQVGMEEPFSHARVVQWTRQLASALAHMHGRKVLHRDLKAANVFLSSGRRPARAGADDLEAKLGDFGLSRSMSEQTLMAETLCGTPYYMSPELVSGQPYAEPADVWALGVLLFELLTLVRPFKADSIGELVVLVMKGTLDSEALSRSNYHPTLKKLASNAELLHPDPKQRLPLDALITSLSAVGPDPTNPRPSSERAPPGERARRVKPAPVSRGTSKENVEAYRRIVETLDECEGKRGYSRDQADSVPDTPCYGSPVG